MAENRGGNRPTAPQNNPANVSATGGAGQSGQWSGFAYGQNQQLNDQQAGAPVLPQASAPAAPPVSPLTGILAPTQRPDEPVTAGIDTGPGPGSEALTLPGSGDTDADNQRLLSYLPALEVAANLPTSSQAFRNYVRILRANLL